MFKLVGGVIVSGMGIGELATHIQFPARKSAFYDADLRQLNKHHRQFVKKWVNK